MEIESQTGIGTPTGESPGNDGWMDEARKNMHCLNNRGLCLIVMTMKINK